ncbi:hypothetical protein OESDEN_18040 [Oesophagostomum dentatum]|uniref:Uncharacterized protein n=1 Tax=Oesophagostomum dentatum TaxID=61180 RepID=A0A0B1SAE3_OESDE|nr:hypothetical protein OESDEN_18040 [Oesophagostomum dentatum]
MITLLETEVNERFQQQKEEEARMLREQREKCTRSTSRISDSINSMRNEMVQLIELHSSLRQTIAKHATDMEAIRTSFNSSYDSVQHIAAELTEKLENLRRNGDRTGYPTQFLQNSTNMYNLPALFPTPPPPPPLPPPASPNRREDEMSTPENPVPRNRQNSASDAVPDHLEEPRLRTSSGVAETSNG